MKCQKLLDHLKGLESDEAREQFATACETTFGYLQQVGYGFSKASAKLAKKIHDESKGAVPKWELRPDYFDSPSEDNESNPASVLKIPRRDRRTRNKPLDGMAERRGRAA